MKMHDWKYKYDHFIGLFQWYNKNKNLKFLDKQSSSEYTHTPDLAHTESRHAQAT